MTGKEIYNELYLHFSSVLKQGMSDSVLENRGVEVNKIDNLTTEYIGTDGEKVLYKFDLFDHSKVGQIGHDTNYFDLTLIDAKGGRIKHDVISFSDLELV